MWPENVSVSRQEFTTAGQDFPASTPIGFAAGGLRRICLRLMVGKIDKFQPLFGHIAKPFQNVTRACTLNGIMHNVTNLLV